MGAPELSFGRDGAQHFPSLAAPLLDQIEAALQGWPQGVAGVRIAGDPAISALLQADGVFGRTVEKLVGAKPRPVRVVLFDKSNAANWALGWHQDRTIAVRSRQDTPGFGPWTVKQGILHVQPPFDLIAGMATLRIHLDSVDADNAPLLIARGSHRQGMISDKHASIVAETGEIVACLAEVGDVWAYATPILHASRAAEPGRRRRVLQVDYSTDDLPDGLNWLAV